MLAGSAWWARAITSANDRRGDASIPRRRGKELTHQHLVILPMVGRQNPAFLSASQHGRAEDGMVSASRHWGMRIGAPLAFEKHARRVSGAALRVLTQDSVIRTRLRPWPLRDASCQLLPVMRSTQPGGFSLPSRGRPGRPEAGGVTGDGSA